MPGQLFTQSAYLDALRRSACVCESTGWTARPELSDLAWSKTHSWGEFVFDFEIARLYQRFGLAYYPKLVLAVPYTPVEGPRLAGLTADDVQQAVVSEKHSSAHILFAPADERDRLLDAGWLRRQDIRFVWHNRAYTDFEAFLTQLSSKKRKNLRAERRAVAALGLRIEWRCAAELEEALWPAVYQLYAHTYLVRGQSPYLNEACLRQWGSGLSQQMQFCLAWQGEQLVAMAFYFQDENGLYGRHWGSEIDGEKLHFELCYYQGIEYCIRHDLAFFDAGVQGAHRLLRGFEPQLTDSLHWFAEDEIQRMLAPAMSRECEHVQRAFDDAQTRTAYRRSD